MVNVKNALAFALLAATASAATLKHDKRHVHHRRQNKPACTTSVTAPYPIGNGTAPTGTGVASSSTESSTRAVVTVSVVPVPVSPSAGPSASTSLPAAGSSAPQSQPTGGAGSSSSNVAPPPAGSSSVCGVATSYVTVQQTVTVTAGQVPATTSSVVVSSSSSTVAAPTTAAPVAPQQSPESSSATTSTVAAPSVAPIPSTTPVAVPTVAPASSSAPAASSSAAAVTPVTGGSYTGKKMGTSWVPGVPFDSLGISDVDWVYNWEQTAQGVPSGVSFVPTLHDASKCAGFADQLASQPGVTTFKHFNEPDMTGNGGSGLSVGEAAALHNQYIKPLASKYAVGLPAVTSNNVPGTSGTGWLTAFVQQVGGCEDFSFADFHFYGGSETVEKQAEIFLGYVADWVTTVDDLCPGKKLPIWISEFSAGPADGNAATAAQFMAVAGPQLETNTRVARYAYFFPSNTQADGVVNGILGALKAIGI